MSWLKNESTALMPVGEGAQVEDVTLPEALAELESYGSVALRYWNEESIKGWSCTCELVTRALGSSFKVESAFRHKTPIAAASECVYRCRTAIAAAGALR